MAGNEQQRFTFDQRIFHVFRCVTFLSFSSSQPTSRPDSFVSSASEPGEGDTCLGNEEGLPPAALTDQTGKHLPLPLRIVQQFIPFSGLCNLISRAPSFRPNAKLSKILVLLLSCLRRVQTEILRIRLYWCKSYIAARWVHREFNLMFTFSRDKNQRKQFAFAQCK